MCNSFSQIMLVAAWKFALCDSVNPTLCTCVAIHITTRAAVKQGMIAAGLGVDYTSTQLAVHHPLDPAEADLLPSPLLLVATSDAKLRLFTLSHLALPLAGLVQPSQPPQRVNLATGQRLTPSQMDLPVAGLRLQSVPAQPESQVQHSSNGRQSRMVASTFETSSFLPLRQLTRLTAAADRGAMCAQLFRNCLVRLASATVCLPSLRNVCILGSYAWFVNFEIATHCADALSAGKMM